MPKAIYLKQLLTGLLTLPGLMGCQPDSDASSLTQSTCERGGDFVWVKAGNYSLGSDRQERDEAYRLSAKATVNPSEDVTKAEKDLRRQGWFDGESDREVRSLPAVCMGKT